MIHPLLLYWRIPSLPKHGLQLLGQYQRTAFRPLADGLLQILVIAQGTVYRTYGIFLDVCAELQPQDALLERTHIVRHTEVVAAHAEHHRPRALRLEVRLTFLHRLDQTRVGQLGREGFLVGHILVGIHRQGLRGDDQLAADTLTQERRAYWGIWQKLPPYRPNSFYS